MRKLVVAAVLLAGCFGCGDKKNEQSGEAPEKTPPAKLVTTDLQPAGVAATVQAPEGASVKEAFGRAEVETAGGGFHIEIAAEKADLAARKQEIEANDVNRFKRYVVDDADGVLYQSELMGKPEYHLLVNVDGGEAGFECEDSKGPVYTEAQARAMFAACRTLTAK